MAEEEKKEGEGEESEAKQPMMSKMGMIVVVVFVVLYTGVLIMVLKPGEPPSTDATEAPEEKELKTLGEFIKIDAVQVNITTNPTTGATRLMNIQVHVEVDAEAKGNVEIMRPWIRSKLIDIVSDMEYRQLAGPDARESVKSKLKSEIQKRLAELGEHKIREVMLVSFMFAG